MRKLLAVIAGAACLSMAGCGGDGSGGVRSTPALNATVVDIAACTHTSPPASSPFVLTVSGSGSLRTNKNGTVATIKGGQFRLETTNRILSCLQYPSFSGTIANDEGYRITGYNVSETGALSDNLDDIDIFRGVPVGLKRTEHVTASVNLAATSTLLAAEEFDSANPGTYHYSASLNVYDTLGNSHLFRLYYLKTAVLRWAVFAARNETTSKINELTFGSDGKLVLTSPAAPVRVAVPVSTGAETPLDILFDPANTTESGSSFNVIALTQDGYPLGIPTGFSIDDTGKVTTWYSNGQSRFSAQVFIASQ